MKINFGFFSTVLVSIFLLPASAIVIADECDEYLQYSQEDRVLTALEILTNATPPEIITIAIMLEEACKGGLPEFSKAEANKDAAVFLPYLEKKQSNNAKLK
tara:strand:- start:769 stop:1074 length:306 start_codon:yes stop_codon:yes gene_type:complete